MSSETGSEPTTGIAGALPGRAGPRVARGLLLAATALGGSTLLGGTGCAQFVTREIEVLFAAVASPTLVRGSYLVDLFGLSILGLFNQG